MGESCTHCGRDDLNEKIWDVRREKAGVRQTNRHTWGNRLRDMKILETKSLWIPFTSSPLSFVISLKAGQGDTWEPGLRAALGKGRGMLKKTAPIVILYHVPLEDEMKKDKPQRPSTWRRLKGTFLLSFALDSHCSKKV